MGRRISWVWRTHTAIATDGERIICVEANKATYYIYIYTHTTHIYFPACGQAVVTGVVPSARRFLPSIFIRIRVQQSHCSSSFRRVLLTHAFALSASQYVHKKKSPSTTRFIGRRLYLVLPRTWADQLRLIHLCTETKHNILEGEKTCWVFKLCRQYSCFAVLYFKPTSVFLMCTWCPCLVVADHRACFLTIKHRQHAHWLCWTLNEWRNRQFHTLKKIHISNNCDHSSSGGPFWLRPYRYVCKASQAGAGSLMYVCPFTNALFKGPRSPKWTRTLRRTKRVPER